MAQFDDIDFEESSQEKKKNREDVIKDILRRKRESVPDLDLETIDEVVNYLVDKNKHEQALSYINDLLEFFPYSNEI